MNSRAIAHKIIVNVIQSRCSLNESFKKSLPTTLTAQERGFIKDCCFGSLRWFHQLSKIKSRLLHSPLKKKDNDIDCLILLGLFQILHSETPDHAAVAETVSVCHTLKKDWAKPLVNKCLRRFIQEKTDILAALNDDVEAHYSHPQWLIEKIQEAWPEHWEDILNANNQKPPLWLRINLQKTSQDDYLKQLTQNNIAASASELISTAIKLDPPLPVDKILNFHNGYASVQDIAGQFAAELLDLKKGQHVLDACAAPGSKTCHILESEPELSKLVIIDNDPARFPQLKENIDRLQLSHQHLQLVLADVTHTQQWWDGTPFDRILLDAPCSSTGVIRRHPDIKLLKQADDIAQLSQLQHRMLTMLWPLLKKGGKLLYSTCSVLPEENEKIIQTFLMKTKDVVIEKIKIPAGTAQKHGVQLLPKQKENDGFYYALLCKK